MFKLKQTPDYDDRTTNLVSNNPRFSDKDPQAEVIVITDNLSINVTTDPLARFLLAVFVQFMDKDLSPWFSLVLHYYVPDTKGNNQFRVKKKKLLHSILQLLQTKLVQKNSLPQPLVHEFDVSTQNKWKSLRIEWEPAVANQLRRQMSSENKWHLVGQLISSTSDKPEAVEKELRHAFRTFEDEFEMKISYPPRVMRWNESRAGDEKMYTDVIGDMEKSIREAPEDYNKERTLKASGQMQLLFMKNVELAPAAPVTFFTRLEDPYAQALLAFYYHSVHQAREHRFSFTLTQSTEKGSRWSNKNIRFLQTICQQFSETTETHILKDKMVVKPIIESCEFGEDEQGRWQVRFEGTTQGIKPCDEWLHWFKIGQIIGTVESVLERDFINQIRKEFRKFVWALEDDYGVKLSITKGSFPWPDNVDPLLDRNKDFEYWDHYDKE